MRWDDVENYDNEEDWLAALKAHEQYVHDDAERQARYRQHCEDVAHARREEAAGRESRAPDGSHVTAWERWLT